MDKKKTARDNFTLATKLRLRDRAGNVCSYPDCHVHTHGSAASGESSVGIGVACHIKAASPGGPRYDINQTPAERSSIENGIWMCGTHSTLVDVDDSAYSVETLTEWKKNAEARSNKLLNKKSFTESDIKLANAEGAVTAIKQWIGKSENPLETPIAEVLKGYESDLESLDPRFAIQVDKAGNVFHHTIKAKKDNVNINLIISDLDKLSGFWEAQKAFHEEGRELKIPGNHVKFEGSKLFEAVSKKANSSSQGTLIIGATKKPISASLSIRNSKGQEKVIDSFLCHYTSGSVRTVFKGQTLGGFFTVNVVAEHDGSKTNLNLTYSLEAWRGINVKDLPKFAKLERALESINDGFLVFEIEVGDQVASFNTASDPTCQLYHEQLRWIVKYLTLARKISAMCGEELALLELDLDEEAYILANQHLKLSFGIDQKKKEIGLLFDGEFMPHDEFDSKDPESLQSDMIIKIVQMESSKLRLFGHNILAPRIEVTYQNLDCIFYTDLDLRSIPRAKLYITERTDIHAALTKEDPWRVLR